MANCKDGDFKCSCGSRFNRASNLSRHIKHKTRLGEANHADVSLPGATDARISKPKKKKRKYAKRTMKPIVKPAPDQIKHCPNCGFSLELFMLAFAIASQTKEKKC